MFLYIRSLEKVFESFGKANITFHSPTLWLENSPLIYHMLIEAVAMYLRSLGIPMLVWIDDVWNDTTIITTTNR